MGRVHRIGQTRDVYIFNLCLAGSVEERILSILHDKINRNLTIQNGVHRYRSHAAVDAMYVGVTFEYTVLADERMGGVVTQYYEEIDLASTPLSKSQEVHASR